MVSLIYFGTGCSLINPSISAHLPATPLDLANTVHPIRNTHVFDFDAQPPKLYRKRVDTSAKSPKWTKFHPLKKMGTK